MFRFPDFGTILRGFVLTLLFCVVLYVAKGLLRRHRYAKGLPGPKFHFSNLLGNISLLPLSSKSRNGHSIQVALLQEAERLAKLYPYDLMAFWIGFHPDILLNSPESVQAVMTDSSLLEKPYLYKLVEPVIGKGLVTSAVSKWKPRRRMLNPSYNVSVLMDFMPIFNEHGKKLVKKLQREPEGKILKLLEPISLCVLDIVAETILGVKIGAQDNKNREYVDGLRTVFSIAMERMIRVPQWLEIVFRNSENGKIFAKNLSTVKNFTRSVLNQKKKEYLIEAQSDNRKRRPLLEILLDFFMKYNNITEEGIIEEVDTFLAASNESTAASLLFTLHLLGLDPDAQSLAHQELDDIFGEDKDRSVDKEDLKNMSYIECVLKESLRLFPTVPIFGREALEDKVICGYTVPKGASLFVIPYILHRDPKLYPDPERFDPSRFFPENCVGRSQYAYIPFSAGARNCIGQKFAMIEMKVVLALILRSFRVLCLDARDKVLPSPELSLRTEEQIRFQLFSRRNTK